MQCDRCHREFGHPLVGLGPVYDGEVNVVVLYCPECYICEFADELPRFMVDRAFRLLAGGTIKAFHAYVERACLRIGWRRHIREIKTGGAY